MTDYEDSPFTSIFSIQDKSLPINDSFIKKDEVRFDEPKVKKTKDNIPYGSMDLGVDPNKTFKVNHKNLETSLSKNPILVTALNPLVGYEKAASIAKKAYKENRPIIDVAAEETDLAKSELIKLLNPSKLAKGGL